MNSGTDAADWNIARKQEARCEVVNDGWMRDKGRPYWLERNGGCKGRSECNVSALALCVVVDPMNLARLGRPTRTPETSNVKSQGDWGR